MGLIYYYLTIEILLFKGVVLSIASISVPFLGVSRVRVMMLQHLR